MEVPNRGAELSKIGHFNRFYMRPVIFTENEQARQSLRGGFETAHAVIRLTGKNQMGLAGNPAQACCPTETLNDASEAPSPIRKEASLPKQRQDSHTN